MAEPVLLVKIMPKFGVALPEAVPPSARSVEEIAPKLYKAPLVSDPVLARYKARFEYHPGMVELFVHVNVAFVGELVVASALKSCVYGVVDVSKTCAHPLVANRESSSSQPPIFLIKLKCNRFNIKWLVF